MDEKSARAEDARDGDPLLRVSRYFPADARCGREAGPTAEQIANIGV